MMVSRFARVATGCGSWSVTSAPMKKLKGSVFTPVPVVPAAPVVPAVPVVPPRPAAPPVPPRPAAPPSRAGLPIHLAAGAGRAAAA